MELNINDIINRLASRIGELEAENTVLKVQLESYQGQEQDEESVEEGTG